jgi:hypothetical protein
MGVAHSGKKGVALWYRNVIVPTLGDGAPLVQELQLNGQIGHAEMAALPTATVGADQRLGVLQASEARADRAFGIAQVVDSSQPEFSGTAAAGSIVRLALSPATEPRDLALAGVATADASGHWSLTTAHPLRNGEYRTLVAAFSPALATRPGLAIVPTQPLGRFVVDAPPRS